MKSVRRHDQYRRLVEWLDKPMGREALAGDDTHRQWRALQAEEPDASRPPGEPAAVAGQVA
jgi:hypothetical protein